MSSEYFLATAESCAKLAREAKSARERDRFRRMEKSWRQVAKSSKWLEGLSSLSKAGKLQKSK